ncbi:helix-turn-helix domain-containing protein [Gorillibacterium timonense]|uniref:helix-turn-helix domain-containing protein n=1 Tax=Gorillibacterium timonense TaxID=1689269 RepID=UPI00071E5C4E|nr:helix-turn-helix transcriptional regulator [Gorillibacterium timonense]
MPSDHDQLIALLKEPAAVCEARGNTWELVSGNRYLAELFGCRRTEFLSEKHGFHPADFLGRPEETIERLLNKESMVTEAVLPNKSGGVLQLEIRPSLLEGAEKRRILLLVNDIGHVKWLQSELLRGCDLVLASGTLLPGLLVETVDVYEEEDPSYKKLKPGSSLLEYLSVLDRTLLHDTLTLLKKRGKSGESKEIVIHSKKMRSKVYRVRCCVAPFFTGAGKLSRFGFVLNRLAAFEQREDPSLRLKLLMTEKGISATELSRLTGLSMTTISKLRNGKIRTPRRLTAELIAAELGVKTVEIWAQ